MRSNLWGYLVMAISLGFGIVYFVSLVLWFKYEILSHKSNYWWTWWIIVVPIALIVGFAVFFVTWIGWVMVKSKPKTVYQLIKESTSKSSQSN